MIPILRRRNERGEAEASLLLFPRGIPFEGTPDGGWTGGASGDAVGAVINRPGDSAPAGGRFRGGCAPHSLFVLDKKRMRRARWKRKNRFIALRHVRASARRGSAYRCLLRFCLAFGHAWVFCEVDTAVPCRMVPTSSGCKDAFDLLLFYCLALRRSQYFRHQCSTGSSFRAFRFATRWLGGGGRWGNKKERTPVRSFLFVL